jgi:hypothetical protein
MHVVIPTSTTGDRGLCPRTQREARQRGGGKGGAEQELAFSPPEGVP